ncbi:MAG: elongation factor P [Deltaproteobacteria bacterium]|nr:elongation factor P [Deltaproteobacteria bacterium]
MYDTSDIRKGLKIIHNGDPYVVVDFQFVKPGKGNAFTRTRIKNLITGSVLDMTYRSGEKLEPADCEEFTMQYLYKEGSKYCFMDTTSYEQVFVEEEIIGDTVNYLSDNLEVKVLFFQERPIGVEVPMFVELQIVECEPGVKGDTATGATKPATLSTGYVVNVPLFIQEGEWIKVDTRDGNYVERIKK